MVYMLTFGVYKWQMLPYMAYMDPMGNGGCTLIMTIYHSSTLRLVDFRDSYGPP